jgi:hypothetical protein
MMVCIFQNAYDKNFPLSIIKTSQAICLEPLYISLYAFI